MMDGQTFNWEFDEVIGQYVMWKRKIYGGMIYQITKISVTGRHITPTMYAGYPNKHALLRMKELI